MRYGQSTSLTATCGMLLGLAVLMGAISGGWLGWVEASTAEAIAKAAIALIIPCGFIKILDWAQESPDEQRAMEAGLAELKRKWMNEVAAGKPPETR